ncbi:MULTISPECIES: hydrogenase formation protein HypD [Paraburkholderia]|uniref:Hydrogenase maturation factor n=2 Tax=Paraburkholderia TaxID=1822464 RepID=A0A248VYB9_9BURK|nr:MULTISPECIES: hydrogenase formation protein HypD [Paraburkholderia]ASW04031.1 hydrogenase formation protein HypD [Paraburkholderia aromaticivorans]CAB3738508.1 Hydrogenase maturation factor HypD [Paraburkholderia phenoliruptrix]
MKYIDEFRDGEIAQHIAAQIRAHAGANRQYSFMEFCGGHTHAISRYGIAGLLPDNVNMIHGPGCPVCVLPVGRIDLALQLALERDVILCTYGDTMRVPASAGMSLSRAKALGADIRMVYSAADALKLARRHADREVVFLAIGFETTTPPTAIVIRDARAAGVTNFSVLCCHVLTPSAITHIVESPETGALGLAPLDGFVGPAHVSIVIGTAPYERFAHEYAKPVVIAGFEPLDVMQAILMLIRQVNSGRAEVENQFTRAVTRDGNLHAQNLMSEVFELRDSFEWRGLGEVPHSALRIRAEYGQFDAERRFDLSYRRVPDNKACECGAILRGVKKPVDCKLFGTVCTPENPMGSCMVSSEGACAAHYSFGRFRDIPVVVA